jgi:hypothetical protein
MKRTAWLAAALLLSLGAVGCVERRFLITSDPPGAAVFRSGQFIGNTPVDDHFVYYGKYEFTLVKDGYQTMHVVENIRPPIYEWPGLDFFAENLWPFRVNDDRHLHYVLPALIKEPPEAVLQRANELRERGKAIGQPGGTPSEAPPPPTRPSPTAPRGVVTPATPPAALVPPPPPAVSGP